MVRLLIFLSLISTFCSSQTGTWQWAYDFEPEIHLGGVVRVDRFGNSFFLRSQGPNSQIRKYDKNGQLLWEKLFSEHFVCEDVDPDGNLLLGGCENRVYPYETKSTGAAVLLKLTPHGQELWKKKYPSRHGIIRTISVLSDGILVGGHYKDTIQIDQEMMQYVIGGTAGLIGKIEFNGVVDWVMTDTSVYSFVFSAALANNKFLTVSNYGVLAKHDPTGTKTKVKSFGDYIYGIAVDKNENVYVNWLELYWTSGNEFTLSKINSDFNHQWSANMGKSQGSKHYFHCRPVVGPNNHVYMGGTVKENSKVILGADTIYLSGYEPDLVVAEIDEKTGNFKKAWSAGAFAEDGVTDLDIDILGNVYLIGWYGDSAYFNKNLHNQILITDTTPKWSMFTAKLKLSDMEFTDAVGIKQRGQRKFNFYPNPADNSLSLESVNMDAFESLEIFNSFGQRISIEPLSIVKREIDVSTWKEGVYLFVLRGPSGQCTKKVLISHRQ